MPAGQSSERMPLQCTVHAAVPPQTTVQPAAPPHSIVQPPWGQAMWHVLSPEQVRVDPLSRVIAQVLPPAQVTWLSAPVLRVHSLVPLQLDVQFAVQVPSQVERPSQVLVQPVPQVTLHWFWDAQL
jgi:hypothetical protein